MATGSVPPFDQAFLATRDADAQVFSPLQQPLSCWHESLASARTDQVIALAVDGCVVKTTRPVPRGTPLFVRLADDDAATLELDAVCEGAREGGFAVRFVGLDDHARQTLTLWLKHAAHKRVELPFLPSAAPPFAVLENAGVAKARQEAALANDPAVPSTRTQTWAVPPDAPWEPPTPISGPEPLVKRTSTSTLLPGVGTLPKLNTPAALSSFAAQAPGEPLPLAVLPRVDTPVADGTNPVVETQTFVKSDAVLAASPLVDVDDDANDGDTSDVNAVARSDDAIAVQHVAHDDERDDLVDDDVPLLEPISAEAISAEAIAAPAMPAAVEHDDAFALELQPALQADDELDHLVLGGGETAALDDLMIDETPHNAHDDRSGLFGAPLDAAALGGDDDGFGGNGLSLDLDETDPRRHVRSTKEAPEDIGVVETDLSEFVDVLGASVAQPQRGHGATPQESTLPFGAKPDAPPPPPAGFSVRYQPPEDTYTESTMPFAASPAPAQVRSTQLFAAIDPQTLRTAAKTTPMFQAVVVPPPADAEAFVLDEEVPAAPPPPPLSGFARPFGKPASHGHGIHQETTTPWAKAPAPAPPRTQMFVAMPNPVAESTDVLELDVEDSSDVER